VQSYTLARRIYTELGLKRVAILRINSRYRRFGVIKFRDASRRLGHPPVMSRSSCPATLTSPANSRSFRARAQTQSCSGPTKSRRQTSSSRCAPWERSSASSAPIAPWGPNSLPKQGLRRKALKPSFPTIPPAKILAGSAFIQRFDARFHDKPEQSASLSYDSVNALLDSVCKAGLNRARIHDALAGIDTWDGVTGKMAFDLNQKNIAPMYLVRCATAPTLIGRR